MKLQHPSVLAAYAGRNNGTFCKQVAELGVGMVTLGGISVDAATKEQSLAMHARGRQEFISGDHRSFISEGMQALEGSDALVAVNIRSATLEGYVEAATLIDDLGGIVEIDAHCRQPEILSVGAGQALLSNLPLVNSILEELYVERDIPTILKVRGHIVPGFSLAEVAEGRCTALHVDAMYEGKDTFDPAVFLDIPDGIFLIGNNSVRDKQSAEAVLEFCDAFSFARLADDMEATRALMASMM
jgi:TIM-barrel protein